MDLVALQSETHVQICKINVLYYVIMPHRYHITTTYTSVY